MKIFKFLDISYRRSSLLTVQLVLVKHFEQMVWKQLKTADHLPSLLSAPLHAGHFVSPVIGPLSLPHGAFDVVVLVVRPQHAQFVVPRLNGIELMMTDACRRRHRQRRVWRRRGLRRRARGGC